MYNRIIAHSIGVSKGIIVKLERTGNMEKYGESFKELSTKKKIGHIWEYYRWHIFSAIVGVIIIGTFASSYFKPKVNYAVDVMIAGKVISDETQPEVIKKFEEELNTSLNIASVNFENMGQFEMVMMQKIPLLIRTEELDVLILSKGAFMSYLNQGGSGMFMPLDDILELKTILEARKTDLITTKDIELSEESQEELTDSKGIQSKDHIYGIKVNQLSNVPNLTIEDELVIGVTATMKDPVKTAEVISYLLQ